jgi:hypothetical protein
VPDCAALACGGRVSATTEAHSEAVSLVDGQPERRGALEHPRRHHAPAHRNEAQPLGCRRTALERVDDRREHLRDQDRRRRPVPSEGREERARIEAGRALHAERGERRERGASAAEKGRIQAADVLEQRRERQTGEMSVVGDSAQAAASDCATASIAPASRQAPFGAPVVPEV